VAGRHNVTVVEPAVPWIGGGRAAAVVEPFAAAAVAAAAPLGFPVNWPQPLAFARSPPPE